MPLKAIGAINSGTDLGKVLKLRRRAMNVTQKQVADFCNLSHNGISQIEIAAESPRLSILIKICKLLGLKIVIYSEEDAEMEVVTRDLMVASEIAKKKARESHWDSYYRRMYGIALEEYNKMLDDQNGKCILCNRPQSQVRARFVMDHDHDTGVVRGLLCHGCNSALEHYEKCVKRTSEETLSEYVRRGKKT